LLWQKNLSCSFNLFHLIQKNEVSSFRYPPHLFQRV
jgi:hypothetical protein